MYVVVGCSILAERLEILLTWVREHAQVTQYQLFFYLIRGNSFINHLTVRKMENSNVAIQKHCLFRPKISHLP
ncbi:MAG: hypothetical protein ACI8RD_006196 [Bacillariaceae sp.]|jgi:hypothetical protein